MAAQSTHNVDGVRGLQRETDEVVPLLARGVAFASPARRYYTV